MKRYIQQAYDKCVYILNNGFEYEFYTNIHRRPTKIILGLDDETLQFAVENNRKYMGKTDFNELWELIKRDNKPWGYGLLKSDLAKQLQSPPN